MSPLLADERIGREFQTADEVESLPVGSVVIDGDGDGWQLTLQGKWIASRIGGGWLGSQALAVQYAPLLLVWLPPEAVSAR